LCRDDYDLWTNHAAVQYSKCKSFWNYLEVTICVCLITDIIVSKMVPSRLTAQMDGIAVDRRCGFGRNRSTADHTMADGQTL
jgi:hypothetical protein